MGAIAERRFRVTIEWSIEDHERGVSKWASGKATYVAVSRNPDETADDIGAEALRIFHVRRECCTRFDVVEVKRTHVAPTT